MNLRRFLIFLWNVFIFILAAIEVGHPPWRWHIGWAYVQEAHLQEVRKIVWAAKCQGLIYEDRQGRLFSKGQDD